MTGYRIGAELGVPARTVSRVLVRRGLPRLAALDPMTGEVIRSSKTTAVRYERSRPGELVHMDVKKLARIPDGGGWRAHGRAATVDHRHKSVPTGFDYVHSLVDDHSRLAYSEILSDEKGVTCAAFLARAAAYFANHGIPRIERVMTYNAWAYRYSLREVITALGARQKFIRPHCPWQNGNVERLNRTLATEWAYRQAFTNNAQRAAALAPGSSTTTLDAATARSAASRRSAGWHQPDGRIHLGRRQYLSTAPVPLDGTGVAVDEEGGRHVRVGGTLRISAIGQQQSDARRRDRRTRPAAPRAAVAHVAVGEGSPIRSTAATERPTCAPRGQRSPTMASRR